MQHDCIHKRLEGLDEIEGEGAEFKRGRGRTDSVLGSRERKHKGNELILGSNPLIKPLCTITNTPLSLIRAQDELTDKIS